jgi:hypothetical protein
MATKRKRSLRGTPSEHLSMATYKLKRLTSGRVERMTCGEIGTAAFEVGTIIAEARNADNAKLFAMASRRRDQIFNKAATCGCANWKRAR